MGICSHVGGMGTKGNRKDIHVKVCPYLRRKQYLCQKSFQHVFFFFFLFFLVFSLNDSKIINFYFQTFPRTLKILGEFQRPS